MSKRPTQTELANLYQTNQPTVARLKKKGVDIYDRDAVRDAILNQKKRSPAWINGCPWDEKKEVKPISDEEIDSTDVDELKTQLLGAIDYDSVRVIQLKIKGLKDHHALAVEQGKYIAIEDVQADMIKIGAAMRSALKSLRHELPATLEGLTAVHMKKKIDDKTHGIMLMLSDELDVLYNEPATD